MQSEGSRAGQYRVPPIGEESPVQSAEHLLDLDEKGVIKVQSPLWEHPYSIGDGSTFTDPRADEFLRIFTKHQFHHLITRQLSFTEMYETRPGASRYSRLGHMLDSAKLLQDMGATFEQQVQALISDPAHPTGSHLRGDFLVGDYESQDTHDADLWSYLSRSGFLNELARGNLMDSEGLLVGSSVKLRDLADPRNPRSEDIVECPRPHPNADRLQFTLHEGVLTHSKSEIQEVLKSLIRIETSAGERMAFTDPDAARLLFMLAVRHQSESWAEPIHRVQEELVLMIDRYLFASDSPTAEFRDLQDYYPVDYARVDEASWQDKVNEFAGNDSFVANAMKLAVEVSRDQQRKLLCYIGDDNAYQGPDAPSFVDISKAPSRRKKMLSIKPVDARRSELWIALPVPKYRGPINSLVVTKAGLKPISEIDGSLLDYEEQRRHWVAPLLAKITLSNDVARELHRGVKIIESHWGRGSGQNNPVNRPPMPAELFKEQIRVSRERVHRDALI